MERRIPWVTYALVLLCVLGFFYAKFEAIEADALVGNELNAAVRVFRERPYLGLPPLLENRVTPDQIGHLRREFERETIERGGLPVPRGLVARQQDSLDRMVAAAGARLDAKLTRRFGARATEQHPVTFVTHAFFHGDLIHLIGNLLVLVLVGRVLESAWGGAVHTCVLAAGALGGLGAFFAQYPFHADPVIGTSGMASGLVGAFAVRFAGQRGRVIFGPSLVLALLVLWLPVWIGFEGSIARGAASAPARLGAWNVSMALLLGGFAGGAMAAALIRFLGVEARIGRAESRAELRLPNADSGLERAIHERNTGAAEMAYRRLVERLRREPGNRGVVLAFWDVCSDLGRANEAAPGLLGLIRESLRNGADADAVQHWLQLVASGLDPEVEPAMLLRMASLLRDAGESVAARRALSDSLQHGSAEPAVAARVAHEAAELDPELARAAADRALGCVGLSAGERAVLEQLRASLPGAGALQGGVRLGHVYRPEGVALPAAASEPVIGPGGIEFEEEPRKLHCLEAVPLRLDPEALHVELGGAPKRVRYQRVTALAVGVVPGKASKKVIVIDLVLNWGSLGDEPLQVVRLRTDRFDIRKLDRGAEDPLAAVRGLIEQLVRRSGAMPLPDAASVAGAPFARFESLDAYHREVLAVSAADLD